jgi:DNA-directed RNA polymerase sigma subunit (sigma70/sigma32)
MTYKPLRRRTRPEDIDTLLADLEARTTGPLSLDFIAAYTGTDHKNIKAIETSALEKLRHNHFIHEIR